MRRDFGEEVESLCREYGSSGEGGRGEESIRCGRDDGSAWSEEGEGTRGAWYIVNQVASCKKRGVNVLFY